MSELEQDDNPAETEHESFDLGDASLSGVNSGSVRANGFDRARFECIPNETRTKVKGEGAASSANPIRIYCRSLGKIPLLTREQEVQLAKRIESSKLNTLLLLSLTPLTSLKIMEMADELNPARIHAVESQPDTEEIRRVDNELPRDDLKRIRFKKIHKVITHLEKQEARYRISMGTSRRCKSRAEKSNVDLGKIQSKRKEIFLLLQKIDFSEDQIGRLIGSVEDGLRRMEEAHAPIRALSRYKESSQEPLRIARTRLKELEAEYLTNVDELQKILMLIREHKTEMLQAKHQFVPANLRLVISMARKCSYPGLDQLDLVQEGNLGLMKAVEKFNYRFGFKFSTYASWWIRQSISRAVADQGRTIRMPVHMVEAVNRVMKAGNELTKRLGRTHSVRELAEELKTPVSKVTNILRAAQEPLSLDSNIGGNLDATLNKFIEDKNVAWPDKLAINRNLREVTASALQSLSPREQQIVRMRYGLNESGTEYTLKEVGEVFQVTRERIRQIEEKALMKLRSPYRPTKLHDFAGRVSKN